MSASGKPVKIHEFTAPALTGPDEHVLCAVIIGPDRDDPTRKTLHLRTYAAALETIREISPESRRMIAEHLDRLLAEFRKMVTA